MKILRTVPALLSLVACFWIIINSNLYDVKYHDLHQFTYTTNLTDKFRQTLKERGLTDGSELWNIALSSPWLFPRSKSLFPYLGLHNNLDDLLEAVSNGSKKVIILGFNWHWQSMIENNIFTLVRFARSMSNIVLAPDETTLAVCIELNLPCYNASSYFEIVRENCTITQEGLFLDPYYQALVWYVLPLYLDILRKGFTIMKADSDISFAGKDIWTAMELIVNRTEADLVFMSEDPVNTGHFYARPNDRVMQFFHEWIASRNFNKLLNDQQALATLVNKSYMICHSYKSCNHIKTLIMKSNMSRSTFHKIKNPQMAAVLTYPSAFRQFGSNCPPNTIIYPCNRETLYIHPICMTSREKKIKKLKELGFWLMADSCSESVFEVQLNQSVPTNVSIIRCVPSPRLWPNIENSFLKCNTS